MGDLQLWLRGIIMKKKNNKKLTNILKKMIFTRWSLFVYVTWTSSVEDIYC